jgi:hypothetical protein
MRFLASSTLLIGFTVTLIACGTSSGQSDTDGLGTESDGEGNDNVTGDGDGDAGDGDGDENSSPSCEALIECVKAVTPEATSSTIAAYGPEGTCFDIPGITPEDCWAECDALRESLSEAYPDAPECGPPSCNNGTLEPNEECDSTSGCSATCTFLSPGLECNPVNNAGCPDDQKCVPWENVTFCVDKLGPLGRGESCGGPDCADGLLCEWCDDSQDYCCIPACYSGSTNEAYGQCPAGLTCVTFPEYYGGSWPNGSGLMGFCM